LFNKVRKTLISLTTVTICNEIYIFSYSVGRQILGFNCKPNIGNNFQILLA